MAQRHSRHAEYARSRRQKRMKLKQLNRHSIWINTPTPSPEPEAPANESSDEGCVLSAGSSPPAGNLHRSERSYKSLSMTSYDVRHLVPQAWCCKRASSRLKGSLQACNNRSHSVFTSVLSSGDLAHASDVHAQKWQRQQRRALPRATCRADERAEAAAVTGPSERHRGALKHRYQVQTSSLMRASHITMHDAPQCGSFPVPHDRPTQGVDVALSTALVLPCRRSRGRRARRGTPWRASARWARIRWGNWPTRSTARSTSARSTSSSESDRLVLMDQSTASSAGASKHHKSLSMCSTDRALNYGALQRHHAAASRLALARLDWPVAGKPAVFVVQHHRTECASCSTLLPTRQSSADAVWNDELRCAVIGWRSSARRWRQRRRRQRPAGRSTRTRRTSWSGRSCRKPRPATAATGAAPCDPVRAAFCERPSFCSPPCAVITRQTCICRPPLRWSSVRPAGLHACMSLSSASTAFNVPSNS